MTLLTCPHCDAKFQDDYLPPDEYHGVRFTYHGIAHKGGRFDISRQAAKFLELLIRADGEVLTTQGFENHIYAERPDRELISVEQIRTVMCELRKALAGSGIIVRNIYGVGYYLSRQGNEE